jgi:hypothetical protein
MQTIIPELPSGVKEKIRRNRTLIAVEQQIAAMGCQVYEVGLFKPRAPGADPHEPEMLPRTWDRATLLKSVPWLRYQNSQGRNIYIRPKGEHHLSMVDDLTGAAIEQMKAEGFTPAVVVETSPGNFQAWLNHGQVLPQRLSTLAARALAARFGGDKGAADWRHFGRLAGFTNRKEKYRSIDGSFPFVRLHEATPALLYPAAHEFLTALKEQAQPSTPPRPYTPASIPTHQLLTIDAFRTNPRYDGDGNRIDLAYAIYAISHGVSEAAIAEAIQSRDLSKKGPLNRQQEYTRRTIAKALQQVDRSVGR